jgi:hypothetical protein
MANSFNVLHESCPCFFNGNRPELKTVFMLFRTRYVPQMAIKPGTNDQ